MSPDGRSSLLLPRLGVILAVVMWGASFVTTKAVLAELTPARVVLGRSLLGAATLVALMAARRRPLAPPRAAWGTLALMGFVGVFLHQMIQAHGLILTSATNTGWLVGLIPIWSALLAALFLGERFGPQKTAGLALGFAGALLVITRGETSAATLALPSARGDLLILASSLNWAVYSVISRGPLRRLGPGRATLGAMLCGLALALPLAVAGDAGRDFAALSARGWGALLFLGVGCSGLGYFFWFGALERLEVSRVASYLYAEPLVTLVTAALLLGERVTATTLLGGAVLLAGVALVQRAPAAAATPAGPSPSRTRSARWRR